MEQDDPPERQSKGFLPFKALGQVATAIARTAGSAIALVEDAELRKKASDLVVGHANKGLTTVRQGVGQRVDNIGQRIRSGPGQVRAVLTNLQKRLEEERLLSLLQEERDAPVDVQIGPQLYEHAPQELRSRLWISLLDNPSLATSVEHSALSRTGSESAGARSQTSGRRASSTGVALPEALPEEGDSEQSSNEAPQDAAAGPDAAAAVDTAAPCAERPFDSAASEAQQTGGSGASVVPVESAKTETSPAGPAASGLAPERDRRSLPAAGSPAQSLAAPPAFEAGSLVRRVAPMSSVSPQASPRTDGYGWARQKAKEPAASRLADSTDASGGDSASSSRPGSAQEQAQEDLRAASAKHAQQLAEQRAALMASADAEGDGHASADAEALGLQQEEGQQTNSAAGTRGAVRRNSRGHLRHTDSHSQPGAHAANLAVFRSNGTGAVPGSPGAPVSPAASDLSLDASPPEPRMFSADGSAAADEGIDAWEMVQDGANVYGFEASSGLTARLHPAAHAQLSAEDIALWQKLMMAITTVPWPISTEFAEESKYNTLLQISIGQEETDDIIARDINRTFPEHPQFGFEQGQRALFRVLKAYSLHDLEVNYCQGMAFVAGIILMYLPEEPAFRMLVRLLDERGPNLRRLYLPGLEGLKQQLRALEWLMERHFPALAAHLQANTVAPVLFASQWLLTLYACPFPSAFSARIIDIILAEGTEEIMLQVALAVVAECESALLQLDDFEDLITYLKVEPVKWSEERQRKVLNAAVSSIVTSEMIRAATFAVNTGYSGSLSRRTSSRHDMSSAAAAAGAALSQSFNSTLAAGPVDAEELSSALQDVELFQDSMATTQTESTEILGTDDLELVLAMDMMMEPTQGVETSAPSAATTLDPIPER